MCGADWLRPSQSTCQFAGIPIRYLYSSHLLASVLTCWSWIMCWPLKYYPVYHTGKIPTWPEIIWGNPGVYHHSYIVWQTGFHFHFNLWQQFTNAWSAGISFLITVGGGVHKTSKPIMHDNATKITDLDTERKNTWDHLRVRKLLFVYKITINLV